MPPVLKRAAFGTLVLLGILYAGDSVSVAYRIPGSREVLGSVAIQREFTVKMKNGKTEFLFDDQPESVTCVNALFPHLGYAPCWYESRYPQKRVEVK